MPRTEEGKEQHQALIKLSAERLTQEGYEVKVLPNKPRVDVLGIKENEKVGVECLVRGNPTLINKKLQLYKPLLSKLIFAVPKWVKLKVPNIEVWQFDLEGIPGLVEAACSLDYNTAKTIDELATREGITRSEIIRKIVEDHFTTVSIDPNDLKQLDALGEAKGITRIEVFRDAIREYLALYIVGREPTVGRVYRRVQDAEKRITHLENLLMEKGAAKP